jgi:hypothetical protein
MQLVTLPGDNPLYHPVRPDGRRYHPVRVTVAMTVIAPDVARALTVAWQAFGKAAGDDLAGWGHSQRHGRGPASVTSGAGSIRDLVR